eukprot:scpid90734/ scgid21523/ 
MSEVECQDADSIPHRGYTAKKKSSDPSSALCVGLCIFMGVVFITSLALGYSYIAELEDNKTAPTVAMGCFIGTVVVTCFLAAACHGSGGAQLVWGIGSFVAFCCYGTAATLMFMEAKTNENHRALGYAAAVFSVLNILPMGIICYACGTSKKS